MTLFNPLSYVVELEAAGVSRQQAQVHAQTLQLVYHEEHRQYATKADLLQVSATLEAKISTEILGVKTLIDDCKKDFIEFRADVSSLKKPRTNTFSGSEGVSQRYRLAQLRCAYRCFCIR